MINLMPTEMKEQIRFAKLNRLALRYLWGAVLVVLALAGVFGWALYTLGMQTNAALAGAAGKQQTIDKLNKTFLPAAKEASDRLNAIKYVQSTQTRFSAVIADIAKVEPQGVSIRSMTLTGADKTPVTVIAQAASYNSALAFRDALVTSPRIAGADLESITANNDGTYSANLVIAFKPGQAK